MGKFDVVYDNKELLRFLELIHLKFSPIFEYIRWIETFKIKIVRKAFNFNLLKVFETLSLRI